MKIQYISQKIHVPLGQGGAEVIAFDLLSYMQSHDMAEVKGLGAFSYQDLNRLCQQLNKLEVDFKFIQQGDKIVQKDQSEVGYPLYAHINYQVPGAYETILAREDHYLLTFSNLLAQFKPDVFLMQAQGSVQCTEVLKNYKAKKFLYVQSGLEVDEFAAMGIQPPSCIANSKYVADHLKNKFKLESHLLYPAIDIERYRGASIERKQNEAFTTLFINPHPLKGLSVFVEIAKQMKDMKFIVLEGWSPIPPQLKKQLESLGNVQCLERTWDLAQLYRSVDLLLVPSQWNEAFGRVVVEAHAADTPTLASRVGGLPEASGEAGMLVDDFKNPQAWIDELKKIQERRDELREATEVRQKNTERFTSKIAAERFMEICKA